MSVWRVGLRPRSLRAGTFRARRTSRCSRTLVVSDPRDATQGMFVPGSMIGHVRRAGPADPGAHPLAGAPPLAPATRSGHPRLQPAGRQRRRRSRRARRWSRRSRSPRRRRPIPTRRKPELTIPSRSPASRRCSRSRREPESEQMGSETGSDIGNAGWHGGRRRRRAGRRHARRSRRRLRRLHRRRARSSTTTRLRKVGPPDQAAIPAGGVRQEDRGHRGGRVRDRRRRGRSATPASSSRSPCSTPRPSPASGSGSSRPP